MYFALVASVLWAAIVRCSETFVPLCGIPYTLQYVMVNMEGASSTNCGFKTHYEELEALKKVNVSMLMSDSAPFESASIENVLSIIFEAMERARTSEKFDNLKKSMEYAVRRASLIKMNLTKIKMVGHVFNDAIAPTCLTFDGVMDELAKVREVASEFFKQEKGSSGNDCMDYVAACLKLLFSCKLTASEKFEMETFVMKHFATRRAVFEDHDSDMLYHMGMTVPKPVIDTDLTAPKGIDGIFKLHPRLVQGLDWWVNVNEFSVTKDNKEDLVMIAMLLILERTLSLDGHVDVNLIGALYQDLCKEQQRESETRHWTVEQFKNGRFAPYEVGQTPLYAILKRYVYTKGQPVTPFKERLLRFFDRYVERHRLLTIAKRSNMGEVFGDPLMCVADVDDDGLDGFQLLGALLECQQDLIVTLGELSRSNILDGWSEVRQAISSLVDWSLKRVTGVTSGLSQPYLEFTRVSKSGCNVPVAWIPHPILFYAEQKLKDPVKMTMLRYEMTRGLNQFFEAIDAKNLEKLQLDYSKKIIRSILESYGIEWTKEVDNRVLNHFLRVRDLMQHNMIEVVPNDMSRIVTPRDFIIARMQQVKLLTIKNYDAMALYEFVTCSVFEMKFLKNVVKLSQSDKMLCKKVIGNMKEWAAPRLTIPIMRQLGPLSSSRPSTPILGAPIMPISTFTVGAPIVPTSTAASPSSSSSLSDSRKQ